MLTSLKSPAGKRWPRGTRFSLSERGIQAEGAYRTAVQEVRAQGRPALESAQRSWATPLGLVHADGVILSELRSGRHSLSELCSALETCGITQAEVREAVDRLVSAGMVEPAPPSPQALA
jgi:hypothetical protein